LFLHGRYVTFDGDQRVIVALVTGHLEKLSGIGEPLMQSGQRQYHAFGELFFLAERLGPVGILPDIRVFQLARELFQPQCFGIEVKDTSADRLPAGKDRRGVRR
jgi:hypothetical protein